MGKNYLRLTGIVLLALMGVMVTASYAQKDAPQKQLTELEEKEKNGTIKLKERAQLAKAKGQKKIVAPGRVSLFPTFRDEQELSENISNYTLVIAQPTRVRAYLDGERIRTWYKFKVLETLSQAPPKLWHISRQAPDELLPVSEDEVLIHREGGVIAVDGVEVTQNDSGAPSFKDSQRYLLLLSFDPSTRIGEIVFGGQSILPINPDNTLDQKAQEHVLKRLIQNRHGGSLGRLKSHLAESRRPQ